MGRKNGKLCNVNSPPLMPADNAPAVEEEFLARLEENPLDPQNWRHLAQSVPEQDSQSALSLEVIIQGLDQLRDAANAAKTRGERPLPSSPLAPPLFRRLAEDCNDPRLLKEAGMLYLSVWRLPDVARQHFERCLRLGDAEGELRPLIEAAAVAVQRLAAAETGKKPEHSGASGARQGSPVVVDMLRRSGMPEPFRLGSTALAAPITRTKREEDVESPLPKSGIECLREAPGMIEQGRLDRARALLLRAGDNPRHGREAAQAWAALGKAHYETGAFAEMEMAYQEASKSEPETMIAHFNLALAKQLNHKPDQAEALYLMADRIQPNHPKILCNLGSLYFQNNRYVEAETVLRRALKADPHYARAWDNLAAAVGAQNKLDESLDACRQAIELRPGYPDAYFKMGVIYFGRSRPAEAVEAFRHATDSPHLASFAFAFLGTIHARLEQIAPATVAIQRSAELDPHGELLWMAWNELGKAHYALRGYRASTHAFEQATEVRPEEAEGWFNLGLAHHVLRELDPAMDCYRRTVELDANFALGWHNLGIVCAESKRHAEATLAFQSELRIHPNNARGWYDLGVSLEAEGRPLDARQAFLRAEELEPPRAATANAA
jgi:tetratricopeptide (TPR) repeat protein